MKLTSDKCAARAGMHMGTSGSCMSFDAFERINLIKFVPLLGFGIAGSVLLKIS